MSPGRLSLIYINNLEKKWSLWTTKAWLVSLGSKTHTCKQIQSLLQVPNLWDLVQSWQAGKHRCLRSASGTSVTLHRKVTKFTRSARSHLTENWGNVMSHRSSELNTFLYIRRFLLLVTTSLQPFKALPITNLRKVCSFLLTDYVLAPVSSLSIAL